MREIKYRAYHKKKKCLVDVLGIDFEHNTVTLAIETNSGEEYYWWSSTCYLDEVELMQYTGFTDKNGKEIYEGDIVFIKQTKVIDKIPHETHREVIFHEGAFTINDTIKWNLGLYFKPDEELKVIGNIYRDKHLLKEKN